MNTIIIILVVLALVIALALLIALFIKKEYSIEREIIIKKPKQEVFNYIKFLKNQNNFSKWALMDVNMKQEFKGTDGTVGFVSAWDSNKKNVGKGEQTIMKVMEGQGVEYNLHFIKPFEGRAIAHLTTEMLSGEQTSVKWGFTSSMKYPMNIMLLFMNMEKMIGNDFETGLLNLKNIMEN